MSHCVGEFPCAAAVYDAPPTRVRVMQMVGLYEGSMTQN